MSKFDMIISNDLKFETKLYSAKLKCGDMQLLKEHGGGGCHLGTYLCMGIQFEEMKHFQLQRKHTSKWPMLRPLGCFRIQVSVCLEIELLFLKYFCNPSFILN